MKTTIKIYYIVFPWSPFNSVIKLWNTSQTSITVTIFHAICWLLIADNGHFIIWRSVEPNGLIVVMKSPSSCWVWENVRCHYIGLDGLTAVIQSLALVGIGWTDCFYGVHCYGLCLDTSIVVVGYSPISCVWIMDQLQSLDTASLVEFGSYWIPWHWS